MKRISRSFHRPHAQNKVISPNELIRQMHQVQRLETRAWTVLALAASLLLMLAFLF